MSIKLTEIFSDREWIFRLVLTISSIGVVVSGLEWMFLGKLFQNDNFFSWKVRKIRTSFFTKYAFFDYVYSYPYIQILLAIQVLSAIILIVFIKNWTVLTICSGIIALVSVLFSLRSYVGCTGADQMIKITFVAGFLCSAFKSETALALGLIFLSVQSMIAYSTPGILRLFEREWKNGTHLLLITRQHTYGNKSAYLFLKQNKYLRILLSWSIMFFEVGFLFALFLPFKLLIVFLLLGFLFHLGNAIIMGLNTFVWAFLAVYPAFIWFSLFIKRIISEYSLI